MALMKGTSDSVIRENIRLLRQQGLSEADATTRAHKFAKEGSGGDTADDSGVVGKGREFVVVTKDFSGLGWANTLQQEGETVTVMTVFDEDQPDVEKAKERVGSGWLNVEELSTKGHAGAYWIFAENNFPKEAQQLRKAGAKVFGCSELSERLEHDRDYGVDVAKSCGLESPPTYDFDSLEEGVAFLEQHTDRAFVFKPDDSGGVNFSTFVPIRSKPKDANRELYNYLSHMKEEPGHYILQERLSIEDVTEVNCELWFYEGEPFLANIGLEVKRKNTYDLGEMTGCGGDFIKFVGLDTPIIQQTVGKMLKFYQKEGYTGFADVNVLLTKDGTPHFLEVCNRFGYNSHPNMFLALCKDSFGNVIADYTDGKVDDMASRFSTDWGTSLTLYLDHPRPGLPVHIDKKFEKFFYPFDGYKEDDQLLLTGYSDEIGIAVLRGKDMALTAQRLADMLAGDEVVSVPDVYYRWDLWEENYYNAPVLRYGALAKRGLV